MGFVERFYAAQVPEWANAYVRLHDYISLLDKLNKMAVVVKASVKRVRLPKSSLLDGDTDQTRPHPKVTSIGDARVRTDSLAESFSEAKRAHGDPISGYNAIGVTPPSRFRRNRVSSFDEQDDTNPVFSPIARSLSRTRGRRDSEDISDEYTSDFGSTVPSASHVHQHNRVNQAITTDIAASRRNSESCQYDPFLSKHAVRTEPFNFPDIFYELIGEKRPEVDLFQSNFARLDVKVNSYGSLNESVQSDFMQQKADIDVWNLLLNSISPYTVGAQMCNDLKVAVKYLATSPKRRVKFLENYASHPLSTLFSLHMYESCLPSSADLIAQVVCPICKFKQLIKRTQQGDAVKSSISHFDHASAQKYGITCERCNLDFQILSEANDEHGASIDYETLLVVFQVGFLADVCRVHAFHTNTEKLLKDEVQRLDKMIIHKQQAKKGYDARRSSFSGQYLSPLQPADEALLGEPPTTSELENVFKELYRGGEMLRAYNQLNAGAFVKLLDYLQRHFVSRAKRMPEPFVTLNSIPESILSKDKAYKEPYMIGTIDEKQTLLGVPSGEAEGKDNDVSPILAAASSFKTTVSDLFAKNEYGMVNSTSNESLLARTVSDMRDYLADAAADLTTAIENKYPFSYPDGSSWVSDRLLPGLRRRYSSVFGGSEKDAHQQLRVRLEEHSDLMIYEIGCMMGVSLCLLLTAVLFALVVPEFMINYTYLIAAAPLFRVLFAVTLVVYGWGAVLYACEHYGVNFVFILNADVRSALSHLKVWYAASFISFVSLVTLVACGVLYLRIWLSHEMAILSSESTEGATSSFEAVSPHVFLSPSLVQFAVFFALLAAVFCPFKTFYYRTRLYLSKTLLNALITPFSNPTFEVAFLTDHLCSLTKVMFDLTYSVCYYTADVATTLHVRNQWHGICKPVTAEAQRYIVFIPFLLRLMQCVKRYLTHGKDFRQLINAGKYATSIIMTAIALVYKNSLSSLPSDAVQALSVIPRIGPIHFHALDSSKPGIPQGALGTLYLPDTSDPIYVTEELLFTARLRSLFVAIAIVATLYQFLWDMRMDWGLLELGPAFPLRQKSVIPAKKRKLVYGTAALVNFILRCAWVDTLLPAVLGFPGAQLRSEMWVFLIISLEIVRRAIWSFFRLENEHLNNVGEYRALKIATPSAPSLIFTEQSVDMTPSNAPSLLRNPSRFEIQIVSQPNESRGPQYLEQKMIEETKPDSTISTTIQINYERDPAIDDQNDFTNLKIASSLQRTDAMPEGIRVADTPPTSLLANVSIASSSPSRVPSVSICPTSSRGPSRLLRIAGRNLLLESVDKVVSTQIQVDKARRRFLGLLSKNKTDHSLEQKHIGLGKFMEEDEKINVESLLNSPE